MSELTYTELLVLIVSAEDRRDLYLKHEMYEQAHEANRLVSKLQLMKETAPVE